MERQVTDAEVIEAGTDALRGSMYFAMPGSVVTYYPATQTADVQPMVQDVRINLTTGALMFEPWPVLRGVRVAWPSFGGFVIAGPLAATDPVTLQAWDLDPTNYTSRSNTPVKPNDVRRLGGNYWRAYPEQLLGPMADAGVAAATPFLGFDGDVAQVSFTKGGPITLGKGATDAPALASLVDGLITVLTATYTPSGTETGLTALLAALAAWAATYPGSTKASLVRCR